MERLKTKENRILKWCMIALCAVIPIVPKIIKTGKENRE